MECPKCGKEVSDKDKVCPHCKKVLKLVCPNCETVNSTPLCTKCGFTILSKCEKCGTVTPTIKGKCSKCGFSTYVSVAMASSNIEQFACLTIDFPNLEDINEVMGSKKLIEKFHTNLDNLIVDFCKENELKREIIDGSYVIKFNIEDSFNESAQDAMYAATEISKRLIFMNFKLAKAKAISLEFKMSVLKRDINTPPENFKSGFDIKLVSNYPKEFRYLNNVQIFTDSHIYQEVTDDYSLSSLSSSYINGEMVTFFELNLKKHLKVEEPKDEEEEIAPVDLAQLEEIKETLIDEHEEIENKLYNKDVIVFDDMKCSFLLSNAYDIDKLVYEEISKNHKKIIVIKSTSTFKPESDKIISHLQEKNAFNKIFRVTCYDMMKYKPYGFFSELISIINGFTHTPKLFSTNNLADMNMLDKNGLLSSLINLSVNDKENPEDARFVMYDILSKVLGGLGKVAIYIDNFELIDESSYEILKQIWQNNKNIVFLASIDIDYAFHKTSHFLFQNPQYSEIRLKPLSIKHILETEAKRYASFSNTYYFTNVLQSMKGSYTFFNCAISYLMEKDIIMEEKDVIEVTGTNTCVIPTDIERLMIKRLQNLQKENDIFKLFSMLCLISPVSDLKTVQLFEYKNLTEILKELTNYNYITIYDTIIYINNYDVTLRALNKVLKEDTKNEFVQEILTKIYPNTNKTCEEITLYRAINDYKNEQKTFEYLSNLSASLGDLSAYLNCTLILSKLMDKNLPEDTKEEKFDEYKMKVYENTVKMLNRYTPKKMYGISKNILSDLEKSDDISKLVSFSIMMLKTSMACGNYGYSLDLVKKVLARLNAFSPNPEADNFNPSSLLVSLIRIIALFSVGRLRECEEVGNEVIFYLKSPKIKNLSGDGFTNDDFTEILNDAITFIGLSKVFLLRKDDTIQAYIDELKSSLKSLPKQFDYLMPMKNVMLGKEISVDLDSKNDEKFAKIIKAILRGFSQDKEDSTKFANDIYEAKICANINDYSQLEVLFDLLIGYAYFKLELIEKAKAIYYNVIELSDINGFKLASYIACYLLSMLYYHIDETDTALGLANNTVSHIEKDNNVGDYMFYLFRVLTSGIYMDLGDDEKALACTQSAVFVKQKDEVAFGLEGVEIDVKERRITDRRAKREDFGGRRKGQRRITDDMKLLENMPQDNSKPQQTEDMRMLKDGPKEETKKHTMFDDMKMLENLPQTEKKNQQEMEDMKMLKIKQEKEQKEKENEMKKAAEATEKLKKEQEKLDKRKKEEEELFGNDKVEFKG